MWGSVQLSNAMSAPVRNESDPTDGTSGAPHARIHDADGVSNTSHAQSVCLNARHVSMARSHHRTSVEEVKLEVFVSLRNDHSSDCAANRPHRDA